MRVFAFIFCFSLLTLSCDKQGLDDDLSNPLCNAVIISDSVFQDLAENQVTLIEASIEDDCLFVSLGIGGCDSNHKVNMVSNGTVAIINSIHTSNMITFDFQDENPQDCEAYYILERQYDLSPLKEIVDSNIAIQFRNSDISVFYQF